jgi:hypothetical protein
MRPFRDTEPLAVVVDVAIHRRNPECLDIVLAQARRRAARVRRLPPGPQVMCQVDERIAERRHLPVEHRLDARRVVGHHDVVETVVAVHETDALIRRDPCRQPLHEPVDVGDRHQLGLPVHLRPAREVACDVAAGAPEVGQTERVHVERVQLCEARVHVRIDRGPVRSCNVRKLSVPVHASGAQVHDVERGADHGLVLAVEIRLRYGIARARKRSQHAIFAVDCMGRRQQRARWSAAQHIAALARELVGRIRLPALELLDIEIAAESVDASGQIARERCDI